MTLHHRSVRGCTQAPDPFPPPPHTLLTHHPQTNRLYVHLLRWPYKFLHLTGPAYLQRVAYAQLLHDASECPMNLDPWHAHHLGLPNHTVTLRLPDAAPTHNPLPVVELFLKP